jgi:transcription antitermination factor NusG
MTAFDTAMIDLYANTDMGVDVTYTPAGGSSRTVRAIQSAPDVEIGGGFVAKAKGSPLRFDFRIAEVPEMAEGDQVEVVSGAFAGGAYVIQSCMADDSRLNWKATLRKAG